MGHSLLALENRLQTEEPSTGLPHHDQTTISQDATKDDEQKDIKLFDVTSKMINFISDRPLGQEERQLIYELTLKKRQSKKSTMSEKQLLAKQQLAKELQLERRNPIDIDSIKYAALNTTLDRSYSMNFDYLFEKTLSVTSSLTDKESIRDGSKSIPKLSSASTSSSCGEATTCDGSFSESDRSYEISSTGVPQDNSDSEDRFDHKHQCSELDIETNDKMHKDVTIRFKKSRLEQLNAELETRLYQYEYLVAQEKALLGAYNMMLFTNKGVNNFHLTQDTL